MDPYTIQTQVAAIDARHVGRVQVLPTGFRVHMMPGKGRPVDVTREEVARLLTACSQLATDTLNDRPELESVSLPLVAAS